MSGDVQPRKRKDKRRKKGQLDVRRSEEYQEERVANILRQSSRSEDFSSPVQHPDISGPKMVKADEGLEDIGSVNSEEVIHIQKDALLGGNICAKIVFFCLLGAIGVMVGLIIVEYRGSKDVETHVIDSPWSQMLEGWVDSTSSIHSDDHADEGLEEASGEEHSGEETLNDHEDHDNGDGHEDEEEEDEDVSEEKHHDVLEGEEENDDVSGEEEEGEEEDEEDDENEENKSEEALDEDNLKDDDDDDVDNLDNDNESNEEDDTSEMDETEFIPEDNEDDNDDEVEKEEDEEKYENDIDEDGIQEIPGISDSEEDDREGDKVDDDDDYGKEDDHLKVDVSEEAEDGEEDRTLEDLQDDEDEISVAHKVVEEAEENIDENQEVREAEGEEEEETSGVALKFGVGVALVVVAHVVLVRKWNSAGEAAKETIPSNESVHPLESEVVVENVSRRQTLVAPPPVQVVPPVKSATYEQEYSNDEDEEEEEEEESEQIKQTMEDLKETYSHLTPEGSDLEDEEGDYDSKFTSKNYTHTPTPPESDQSEPEAEEDEEEDDPMRQWQSRQAAHLLAEEVEDVQTGTEEEEESDDEPIAVSSTRHKSAVQTGTDEEESDDEPPVIQSTRRKGHQEAEQSDQQPETEPKKKIYANAEITNQYDWDFQEDLDFADGELNEGHAERALSLYTSLLARAPYSPRAHHGKAKSLDHLAEKKQSNELLVNAIKAYNDALNMPDIPDKLFIQIANRTIDRMRFKGMHLDAVKVHNKLIARFHDNPLYRSQLAVTYLMINRLRDAKVVLGMNLQRWPQDGLSNCLYGLLLKLQGDYAASVPHLKLGINSSENGTQESNFFFHLGDALVRIGQPEEAMKVYEDGTAKGLFRSKYQRSLYNVDRLSARPWWTAEQTTYKDFFQKLEKNWKIIRDEGLSALQAKKGFLNESESLRKIGDWKQFEIFARGRKSIKNCQQTPVTCQLVESFSPASGCRRGQTKFSVMEGGTHVWPHCGPTNSRLRAHLGLVVPPKTFIRVADEIRSWQEGKVMIFDDSFEHEVWHNGTKQRLVLIVDIWHPELTLIERRTLSAI